MFFIRPHRDFFDRWKAWRDRIALNLSDCRTWRSGSPADEAANRASRVRQTYFLERRSLL